MENKYEFGTGEVFLEDGYELTSSSGTILLTLTDSTLIGSTGTNALKIDSSSGFVFRFDNPTLSPSITIDYEDIPKEDKRIKFIPKTKDTRLTDWLEKKD